MLSLFNDFIILPFQGIYSIFSNVFGLGTALIVFSVFISILTIPLMKWAQKQRLVELQYQTVLEPQIKEIKTNYKGQAKSDALSALYKRYSYNPLFAARQSMQALVQVPVLIIAYIALESYLPLKGSSFLCFKDLSVADNLLFGLPLLPFVMTIINMCTTYLSDFTKKEKTQGYLIAFAFLVILFFAPAALLIYWTSNNLINLLKTLFAKVHKGSKFNFVTLALATFTTLNP
ncbi:MAG: YidC/Oxa1 family membrane protein insertase, partial [Succinivibrio sp.]|nr:YidC/Oxa1 family membrane protein insertase [Succinivibrio sp.]